MKFWNAVWIGLLLLGGCLPSVGPSLKPIDPVEPTEVQWQYSMPLIAQEADGTLVATITKIEDDWTYDQHCGILTQILHGCGGMTFTKRITLDGKKIVWTWTSGNFGLYKGERALFLWHYVYAARRYECEEHGAMSSQSCLWDKLPALTDDLNVLPVADTARVESLRKK